MKSIFLSILLLCALTACRKPEEAQAERHYQLSGKIVALNAKDQTATIDAAAMPGFMEAMTMEYPVHSKAEFQQLRVGEKIEATVNVRGGADYDVTNIRSQGPGRRP